MPLRQEIADALAKIAVIRIHLERELAKAVELECDLRTMRNRLDTEDGGASDHGDAEDTENET